MSLGQRIARLRQERNQTLQEVANGAKLTPSFLSRLERDQVNISVANLRKLAQFFGVPMTFFFEGEQNGPAATVVRAGDRRRVSQPRSAAHVYALTPPQAGVDARLVEAQPGVGFSVEGEQMLFVLAGDLRCQVGELDFTLAEGDTLMVHRAVAFRWQNVGAERAMVLLVQLDRSL
jgi:transcriptional regulator with XRE-family HTH domain